MLGCEKDEHIYLINRPIFRLMIEQVIISYYDILLQRLLDIVIFALDKIVDHLMY
jgi:hypothetical protein